MRELNTEKYLIKEMKDFVVNTGWTHKIQITQSDLYEKTALRMRFSKIICAALTSAGLASLILKLLPDYQAFSLVVIFVLSLSTVFIELLEKDRDYNSLIEQTKNIANQFCDLRLDCESLISRLKNGYPIEPIQEEFDNLKSLRKALNKDLLNPTSKAVSMASKKIKTNKDNDYTEDYKYFNLED